MFALEKTFSPQHEMQQNFVVRLALQAVAPADRTDRKRLEANIEHLEQTIEIRGFGQFPGSFDRSPTPRYAARAQRMQRFQ